MFYRKDLQLERRIRDLRTSDDDLGRVVRKYQSWIANQARNVVRMEVTLGNLRAIRSAFGFDAPWAPTFRFMARRDVGDFFFGRELDRLRLLGVHRDEPDDHEDEHGVAVEHVAAVDGGLLRDEAGRIRSLFDRCIAAQRAYNSSDRGRRHPIRDSRLRSLFASYMLYGPYTHADLLGRGGYAPSTLGKDLRQLAALGLPQAGTASTDIQNFLEEYMQRLRGVMPGITTELPYEPDDWTGLARHVPWANDDEAAEAEGEQHVDVAAAGFEDLLEGLDADDDNAQPIADPIVEEDPQTPVDEGTAIDARPR